MYHLYKCIISSGGSGIVPGDESCIYVVSGSIQSAADFINISEETPWVWNNNRKIISIELIDKPVFVART